MYILGGLNMGVDSRAIILRRMNFYINYCRKLQYISTFWEEIQKYNKYIMNRETVISWYLF